MQQRTVTPTSPALMLHPWNFVRIHRMVLDPDWLVVERVRGHCSVAALKEPQPDLLNVSLISHQRDASF